MDILQLDARSRRRGNSAEGANATDSAKSEPNTAYGPKIPASDFAELHATNFFEKLLKSSSERIDVSSNPFALQHVIPVVHNAVGLPLFSYILLRCDGSVLACEPPKLTSDRDLISSIEGSIRNFDPSGVIVLIFQEYFSIFMGSKNVSLMNGLEERCKADGVDLNGVFVCGQGKLFYHDYV